MNQQKSTAVSLQEIIKACQHMAIDETKQFILDHDPGVGELAALTVIACNKRHSIHNAGGVSFCRSGRQITAHCFTPK